MLSTSNLVKQSLFGLSAIQSRSIFGMFYENAKKVMPKMSETEKAALEAGTVGFDRDIYSGKPSLSTLMSYEPRLTEEEQSFLDNETMDLCKMLNDYEISRDRDLPKEVWDYIKKHNYAGLCIPKEYGGKGFSGMGHSQVFSFSLFQCSRSLPFSYFNTSSSSR